MRLKKFTYIDDGKSDVTINFECPDCGGHTGTIKVTLEVSDLELLLEGNRIEALMDTHVVECAALEGPTP